MSGVGVPHQPAAGWSLGPGLTPLSSLPAPHLEFKEQFKLCINRSHRGFRRALQTKGIKFEVVHKGCAGPRVRVGAGHRAA